MNATSPREPVIEQAIALARELREMRSAYQTQCTRLAALESVLCSMGVQPYCVRCAVNLSEAQMAARVVYCGACQPFAGVPA